MPQASAFTSNLATDGASVSTPGCAANDSPAPASDKNLPERLANEISRYIISHGLAQGDRLPNEAELTRMMGAGRSSVREAMKLLASRHIVVIKQGSGTYVATTPGMVDDPLGFAFIPDKLKLARDLLEIRFMIEPRCAALAAQTATTKDIEHLRALCVKIEQLMDAGEPYDAADAELHRSIAELTGNIVLPRLMPAITDAVPLFIELTEDSLVRESATTHRAIVDAIATHDETAAHDAMYLHLVMNRQRLSKMADNTAMHTNGKTK